MSECYHCHQPLGRDYRKTPKGKIHNKCYRLVVLKLKAYNYDPNYASATWGKYTHLYIQGIRSRRKE